MQVRPWQEWASPRLSRKAWPIIQEGDAKHSGQESSGPGLRSYAGEEDLSAPTFLAFAGRHEADDEIHHRYPAQHPAAGTGDRSRKLPVGSSPICSFKAGLCFFILTLLELWQDHCRTHSQLPGLITKTALSLLFNDKHNLTFGKLHHMSPLWPGRPCDL